MKTLILTQNVNMTVVNAGLDQVKTKLAGIGFPIEFTIKETTRQFHSVPFSTSSAPNGFEVNPQEILAEEQVYGDFEVDCLIYDETKVNPKPTNPADNAEVMQIPQNWYVTYPEVLCEFFLHELCHERFWSTGKPDVTHNYAPGFNTRVDWYLYLLKQMIPASAPVPPSTSPYKWFSLAEVAKWKMKPEVWQALDKMREIASTAFNITSGFRTPQENQSVGGKPNSSHLRGLAVDLACTDNAKRTLMLKGIYGSNVPCFVEIAARHIHIDLDLLIHPLNSTIIEPDDN